jgi:glycosyltransferase involved in cell wall biosynthesis
MFEKLEGWALRRADVVITISPSLANLVEGQKNPGTHFLIENSIFDEIRTVEPSVSAEATTAELPELPTLRPIIGYAGTFEVYQGIDLLLEAFAIVRQSMPEAFLLMVGGAPDQMVEYQEMAQQLALGEDCLFTGRLSQGQARKLLAKVDVAVSPRTQGTNTPLKIYEILASGIPLVATRIESHTQVLSDAICFLADPEPEAFAAALESALGNPDQSRQLAESGRNYYEEHYSRAAYKQKIAALLEVID